MSKENSLYQTSINYLIRQSSKPTGFIGKLMIKIWSNYFKNLSRWSFRSIDLAKQDIILDVGFGGGANIKYIKKHGFANKIYGIDISEEAVKTVTRLNQKTINSGELILTLGDVANLQFRNNFFDLVVATQTHIYWKNLKEGLTECYRSLKTDGTLLITCEIDKIRYHLPKYKNSSDFVSLLHNIGFDKVNIKTNNTYIAFICTK